MPTQITWADYDALVGQGREHVLVDVREDDEWRSGHVEGALHIARGQLAARVRELLPDTSATVITCCRSGGRAAAAAEELAGMGYQNLSYIVGDAGDHYSAT